MRLGVYTEPEFGQSLWYAAALRGIGEEARRKRYELAFVSAGELGLDETSDEALLDDVLLGDESSVEPIPPLIVIASSPTRLARLTEKLKARELGALLVNIVPESGEFSSISMDYENSTRLALSHLYDCGRERLALFAINPDSGSDHAKLTAFNEAIAAKGSFGRVFYNRDGLESCVREFLDCAHELDGVICANDIAGIALLTKLREAGVDVPGKLSLMSFGDSASAGSLCTSLGVTLITVDHAKLGRQAVTLAAYLARAGSSLSATVKLSSELVIGRTTEPRTESKPTSIKPCESESFERIDEPNRPSRDFYDDPLVREVMLIEALAESLDETDRSLLSMLASGVTVQSAAEKLYLSHGTASYRLRRMISQLGLSSRGEMLALVKRYFEVRDKKREEI